MKVVILGEKVRQVAVQLPDGTSLFVADTGTGKFLVYAMEAMKIEPLGRNSVEIRVKGRREEK